MIYLVAIVAIIMLALGGFGAFERYRAQAAQAELKTLQVQVMAARERATALALLWAKQVEQTDAKVRAEHERDTADAQMLFDAAAQLPAAPVRLSGGTRRVLDAASRLANTTPADAPVSQAPSGTVPEPAVTYTERELGTYIAQAATAYHDAVGQWTACVEFYEGLRGTP